MIKTLSKDKENNIFRDKNMKESEKDTEEMTSNWDQTVETFDELGLKKDLLRGTTNFNIFLQESMDMDLKSLLRFSKRLSYR